MSVKMGRYSYGIACVDASGANSGKMRILLVQRRITYSFHVFAHGKYNSANHADLKHLFGGMTINEKLLIRSLNFEIIWYHLWLGSRTPSETSYCIARAKYINMTRDGGKLLNSLMNGTPNAQLMWCVPRGHKHCHHEGYVMCAMREFEEETGIDASKYRFTPRYIIDAYMDRYVNYSHTYYIAFATESFDAPKMNIASIDQVSEINDIRWFSMKEVEWLNDPHLRSICERIFAHAYQMMRPDKLARNHIIPMKSLTENKDITPDPAILDNTDSSSDGSHEDDDICGVAIPV